MALRRTRALAVALALGAATVVAGCSIPGSQVSDEEGIVGTYTLNGLDVDDAEYAGTVIISEGAEPGTYAVQWLITEGIHEGTGRLVGDELTVDWHAVDGATPDAAGTATYTLDADGNLHGTRTFDGVDGEATEDIFQEA